MLEGFSRVIIVRILLMHHINLPIRMSAVPASVAQSIRRHHYYYRR